MIDQTENQQNTATVDSCFELGSRQHGVAQQNSRTANARSVVGFGPIRNHYHVHLVDN